MSIKYAFGNSAKPDKPDTYKKGSYESEHFATPTQSTTKPNFTYLTPKKEHE